MAPSHAASLSDWPVTAAATTAGPNFSHWLKAPLGGFFMTDTTSVITGTANQKYVRQLFSLLLGRVPANDADIAPFVNQLSSTPTAGEMLSVLSGIMHSEYSSYQIATNYQLYLERAASGGEISAWLSAYNSGTFEGNALGLLGSAEFHNDYANNHSGNVAFVDDVFQMILGRSGIGSSFVTDLDNGASRADVINAVLYSAEARTITIQSYYIMALNRAASDAEVAAWNGTPLRSVLASILASSEAYGKLSI